jgi:Ca2+-binding EF-hand superfamily protein
MPIVDPPADLFTFLANAADVCGELASFCPALEGNGVVLSDLRNGTRAEVEAICASVGMQAAQTERVLERLHVADTRFFLDEPVKTPSMRHILTEIFNLLDEDNDGGLDLGEYLALAETVAPEYRSLFPTTFLFIDGDSSGKVSLEEWLAQMQNAPDTTLPETEAFEKQCIDVKAYLKQLPRPSESAIDRKKISTDLFEAFDSDGDGVVELREFLTIAGDAQTAALMCMWFQYMDRLGDGDGKVQLSEWLEFSELYNKRTSDADFERGAKEMLDFVAYVKSL